MKIASRFRTFFFFFFFQFLTSLHSNFSYLNISIQTKDIRFLYTFSNFFKFSQINFTEYTLDSFSFNLFFHSRINSCELTISFDFLRQKFRAFSTRPNILISIETDYKSRKKISPVLHYLQWTKYTVYKYPCSSKWRHVHPHECTFSISISHFHLCISSSLFYLFLHLFNPYPSLSLYLLVSRSGKKGEREGERKKRGRSGRFGTGDSRLKRGSLTGGGEGTSVLRA